MPIFFKNIRRRLFSNTGFSKYLPYAVGEIILVVLGILLALQIDEWHTKETQNKEERRILTNLKADLQKDVDQLNIIIRSAQYRRATTEIIFSMLAKPYRSTVDSFLMAFNPLLFESHFEVNSGTFDESLASGTIKFIKNDSLRQQIFEYYRDAKLSYSDQNAITLMYEKILPQFAATLAPSEDFVQMLAQKPTLLPHLNLAELAKDKDFYAMLVLKYGMEEDQIKNWNRLKKSATALLNSTNNQLKK